jgi:outer membrane protein assembly factor BamB
MSAMPRWVLLFGLLLLAVLSGFAAEGQRKTPDSERISVGESDWPWWRGPRRNGVAGEQKPPLTWSEAENELWKVPVPGRGHGSPIVVGDQVLLATAEHDSQTQSVICYDRKTGKQLWKTPVHRGNFETKGNRKASLASSTVACDGERLFINFLNNGAVWTTALSRQGKVLWQTKITDYVIHQGYGSSPAVYRSLVIVSADNKGGGAIAGLDRQTGKVIWKHQRPKFPNYASPIILNIDGRDQLFLTGCDKVSAFDPMTGKVRWEIKGATTECVTSTVTDGRHIFTSGGYPRNHVSAVQADGSGKVVWENGLRVYVPSMLVRDGYLYAVLDAGIAVCWKCDSGKEMWRGRLRGTFSASPVLVGETVFATNESGRTFLFKAAPDAFKLLGENQLGNDVLATPTFCGGRIYFRVAHKDKDKRQEMLYCIGKKP